MSQVHPPGRRVRANPNAGLISPMVRLRPSIACRPAGFGTGRRDSCAIAANCLACAQDASPFAGRDQPQQLLIRHLTQAGTR